MTDARTGDGRRDPHRPQDPHRRQVLAAGAALAGGALAGGPARAQTAAPQPDPLAPGQRFDPAQVVEAARALAKRAYAAPPTDLPDGLKDLTYEQYVGIRPRPSALVWEGEGRGFVVEPLHRGFVFTTPVALSVVEDGAIRRIGYDRSQYDFGRLKLGEAKAAEGKPGEAGDLGFSGFRLHAAFAGGPPADFAIVQGASFFRLVAAGQGYGVTARALTLSPAEAKGEEFPQFRAFWIERPAVASGALTLHALVDSPSATAAIRMTLRPGEASVNDVEGTLFARANLDHIGLGGMATSYLFGAIDRRGVDDARPNVYESGGLRLRTGVDEAIWRPIQNPETLQISSFLDRDPKGFGLMQRDREYPVFQDDGQRWERRPSLWVQPLGPWGEGVVQLLEIPSDSEVNDNVLAYWRPKAPLAQGGELSFAYRQLWTWADPEPPPLALAVGNRCGHGSQGRRRLFLVDFRGERLGAPPADLKAVLGASPGTITRQASYAYPERKVHRVVFELDPGNERACELRLTLKSGERPLSETWLYRWTP